jgi:protein TonB
VAFEAFRTQDRRRPTKLRNAVIAVAAVFHGALIAAGVIYSYWHVDELTPPTLRVTFIAAAPPPPPPPPPPPAGGGGAKKVAMKPKAIPTPVVVPKPTDIVQPREKPPAQVPVKKEFRKHDDEEDDEDDDAPVGAKGGVKGGTIGGVEGGTIGGTLGGTMGGVKGGTIGGAVGAPLTPKILPPNLGALQRQNCADPPFPPSLRRADSFYLVMAKVCVATTGKVESVTLMKKADALLDAGVISSEKACQYKPLYAGGIAVPFCYIARYEFKGQ